MKKVLSALALFALLLFVAVEAQIPPVYPIYLKLKDVVDVSSTTPTDGQVLKWVASTSRWTPSTGAAAGMPAGSTTQVQYNVGGIFGANANFVTDTAGNLTLVSVKASGADLLLQDDAAQNVDIFGSAASGETPALTVSGYKAGDSKRVFSLAVGSVTNDTATITGLSYYTFAGQLSATTYASDGSVTDAELKYINSLSSNAQDQITAKQAGDAALTDISGLTYASDSFIKFTANDDYTVRTLAETAGDLESEIEADIDTLANLTSIQGQTFTLGGSLVTQNNNVTINAITAARTITLNESLTIVDGQDVDLHASGGEKAQLAIDTQNAERTLDMSANLTVEATSVINSDLSTDANWSTSGTLGSGTHTIADGSSISLQEDMTYTGATGVNLIKFPDNLAEALVLEEGGTSYQTFVSTNGSEEIQLNLDTQFDTVYYNDAETTATPSAGFTVDWNVSNCQRVTITGTPLDITFTNPPGPARLILIVVQGDGDDTIDWTNEADILFPGAVDPTLSTGAGDIDVVAFYFDGTSYLGVFNGDFD